MEDKKWIKVYRIDDPVKAKLLESLLKENHIPIDVYTYLDPDVIRSGISLGKGVIRVREDYVEQAKKIIDDFEKGGV